jgi:hypothetical protein
MPSRIIRRRTWPLAVGRKVALDADDEVRVAEAYAVAGRGSEVIGVGAAGRFIGSGLWASGSGLLGFGANDLTASSAFFFVAGSSRRLLTRALSP